MKNNTELKPCPFCGGKAIISDGFMPDNERFIWYKTCGYKTLEQEV